MNTSIQQRAKDAAEAMREHCKRNKCDDMWLSFDNVIIFIRDALTAQQSESDAAHKAEDDEILALIREFRGSGAGIYEIKELIKDATEAEKVLPEGAYEGADGLEDVIRWLMADRDEARAQVAALSAQVEALKKDGAMLDWLEAYHFSRYPMAGERFSQVVFTDYTFADSIREAITAAMEASK
jgi:DNA-binding transcriptional MerR regulator